jgi:SAM-dependent methyltransferase
MIDYRDRIKDLAKADPPTSEFYYKRIAGFTQSGQNLVEEINSLNPGLVVDVGCGGNYFKNKIKNLIGFDICDYPEVDFCCAIEDMILEPGSVDIILALGSLQYTDRDLIYKDISKIVNWLRPGGFIVVRIANFVSESMSKKTRYPYRWSQEWFEKISADFKLTTIKGPVIDNNTNTNIQKTVWWWQKQ